MLREVERRGLLEDFQKRAAAMNEWAQMHPNASLEDIFNYRGKVAPTNWDDARLFDRWYVEHTRSEIGMTT